MRNFLSWPRSKRACIVFPVMLNLLALLEVWYWGGMDSMNIRFIVSIVGEDEVLAMWIMNLLMLRGVVSVFILLGYLILKEPTPPPLLEPVLFKSFSD